MLSTVTINRGTGEMNSFAFAKDHTWLCASWWLASSEVPKKCKHFILDERKQVWSKELNVGAVCTLQFYRFVLVAEATQSFNVEGGKKREKAFFPQRQQSAVLTFNTSIIHPD